MNFSQAAAGSDRCLTCLYVVSFPGTIRSRIRWSEMIVDVHAVPDLGSTQLERPLDD